MLAIEGKIDPHKDFAYDYLEKRLCLCVGIIPEITPARFIHFAMSSASNIEAPYESKRFAESASPQLKKLWNEAVKQIGMGIIVNSILIVFPVAAIVIVHHWLEWARYLQGNWIAKKFKKITKAFVEQEMIEVGGKLLPA
jgi:hypothetical protein